MSSAGTAAPSGLSSFLNGIPAPTTTSQSTQYPAWLQSILQGTLEGGAAAASQPFNPFPGPTVATPSAQTTQAQTLAGQNVGNYQPALNQAQGLVAGSGAPITSGDVSTFLNPYQDYVTGALNRNLTQNILPSVQDKFVSAGQSRSPQEASITGQAIHDTQDAVGQSLAGGFQGALNSLQQERQQQANSGNVLGQQAVLQSNLGAADVGSLAASGATQDQYAQSNINAALNQFQQQQQYPYQQIGFLANLLQGTPLSALGPTTTRVDTNYANLQPSPLATFGTTLAGANSLSGGSQTLARGGRVMMPPRRGALEHMRMAA